MVNYCKLDWRREKGRVREKESVRDRIERDRHKM